MTENVMAVLLPESGIEVVFDFAKLQGEIKTRKDLKDMARKLSGDDYDRWLEHHTNLSFGEIESLSVREFHVLHELAQLAVTELSTTSPEGVTLTVTIRHSVLQKEKEAHG